MRRSVFKNESSVNNGIASLRSFLASLVKCFADSSDKFRGDTRSDDFVYKFISSFISMRVDRLNIADDSSILPSTAGLLFVKVVEPVPLSDSFPVVDAWLTCFAIDAKLSFDSLDIDLEVQLSHPTDNHLLRLFVNIHAEGGIFPLEFGKRLLKLGGSVGLSRLDGETHDGIGNKHTHASDRETVVSLSEGIPCRALDSEDRKDITGFDFFYFLHIVSMHLNDP